MGNTDKFYVKEEVLLEIPRGKDRIKVMVGTKSLRGETKEYLDIRSWYPDNENNLLPGKGFAKPLSQEEMLQMADVIRDYVAKSVQR